MMTINKTED